LRPQHVGDVAVVAGREAGVRDALGDLAVEVDEEGEFEALQPDGRVEVEVNEGGVPGERAGAGGDGLDASVLGLASAGLGDADGAADLEPTQALAHALPAVGRLWAVRRGGAEAGGEDGDGEAVPPGAGALGAD